MNRPVRVSILSTVVLASAMGPARLPTDEVHPTPAPVATGRTEAALADLPLNFIENRGQVPGSIHYYLHGTDTSVGFSSGGLLLSLADRLGTSQRWGVGLEFVGARATPVGRGITPAVVSYFKGDPEDWVTGLPTYSRVAYPDLWPGIELVYSGTGSRLKYSFVVQPGADPADIRLALQGASGLRVNAAGQLEGATPLGDVVDDTPYTYQVIRGRRVEVPSAYSVAGDRYGFDVGSYEPTRRLVIDPAMFVYAGYIGGSGSDEGRGIAVDSSGAAYVTGVTSSTAATFPDGDGLGALPGPDSMENGGTDVFVAKVNPSGTALVYAGYIGGSNNDEGHGIAVGDDGAAYITGTTFSDQNTFPTVGASDNTYGGNGDGFTAKVAPNGMTLQYAGFVGGDQPDVGEAIAVRAGEAYVAGRTSSAQGTFFASGGPDTSYNGGGDAFVQKLTVAGSYIHLGYIGGANVDVGEGIAVDGSGNAYVTGTTASPATQFPDGDGAPTGPEISYNGGVSDAFVAKVNYPPFPNPSTFAYTGYVGGSSTDTGFGIAVDAAGAAYVTGDTISTQATFPDGDGFGTLTGPDTSHNGGTYDAYLAKVVPSGMSLDYAGYIGGSGVDGGLGVAVDAMGAAHVTGATDSNEATFPDGDGFGTLTGPDTSPNGGDDAFWAKVVPSGMSLAYAGYIGGSALDYGNGIAVDGTGAAYVGGSTTSAEASFPDLGGPDTSHNGANDAFVAKIAEPVPQPAASCAGKPATLVGTEGGDTLTGTATADVIAAMGGNDVVKAKAGKDLVCAGSGRDTANGGGGKDKVNGEAGKDKLKGAGGRDQLNGGPGKDTCIGGPGKDKAPKCEKKKSIP